MQTGKVSASKSRTALSQTVISHFKRQRMRTREPTKQIDTS
jgi:hypothetical protein